MERTVSAADATLRPPETGAPVCAGMPRRRPAPAPGAPLAPAPVRRPGPPLTSALPSPTGTPFTFGYAAVLLVTSLLAQYADPALVQALSQGSSTDVAHLLRSPAVVLLASALWIAGGPASYYTLVFLVVLTALERRIGGPRVAVVFLLGHAFATLGTEVPVGLAVLAGRLPDSSLHRLDYGISYGVAASLGALTGLLRPWLRWTVLIAFAAVLLEDLAEFTDPLSNCGHLLALAVGVGTWPLVRRWQRAQTMATSAPTC